MQGSAACHRCGATLAAFATEGFCLACMLEAGLDFAGSSVGSKVSSARQSFGDYELVEEIARGGMGVVFKARQLSLGRTVALKMILAGRLASEVEVQRFRDEARAVAALHHPNIVAIHEVGEIDGQPFFSMDLVEGQNVAEAVLEGPFTPTRAAACVRAVAEAIHYAHEHGILHRDLKSSNVLLDRDDRPHVTDFGLAKHLPNSEHGTQNAELTLSGQVLGSPNFMPPEQAAGKCSELTAASDVYSLGALLYHVITGRPPFLADSVPATLRLVMETELAPPRLLMPTVPRDLETICLKCLDKDPQRRYGTARELADELARFLRDEPIHARPVGRWEKFLLWTRRHPIIAALTGAIGVLIMAVALISTVAATRLQRANREGQENLREAYLSQARANRWSGRPGRRFDSLEAIRKAAEIRPGVDLRNEAIAAMALVDIHPTKSWNVPAGSFLAFNAAYDLYMRGTTNGPITLHRVADDLEVARHASLPALFQWAALSPGGTFVSIYAGTDPPRLEIFKWGNSRAVLTITNLHVRSHDFSSDESQVAIGGTALSGNQNYRVLILDVSSGRTNAEFAAHTLPSVRFSPGADKVAVFGVESGQLEIRDVHSGRLLRTLCHASVVRAAVWRQDGRQMAAACDDGNVVVWDLTKAKPTSTELRHGGVVTTVSFSPDGELLASQGWNNELRLWEVRTGRELLRQAAIGLHPFDSRGRSLAVWPSPNQVDLCDVATAREVKAWQPGTATRCSFSPDGSFTASTHPDGIRFWEWASGSEIGFLPEAHVQSTFFDAGGESLFTTSEAGLRRWSLRRSRVGSTNVIEVTMHALICNGKNLRGVSVDHRGERLAVDHDGWLEVYDSGPGRSLFPRSRQKHITSAIVNPVVSPRGDWVAAYEWSGGGAHVWELAGNDKGHRMVPNASGVAFSPDGRWLVTSTTSEFVFLEMKTWKTGRRIPRPINSVLHATAVFSPDSRTVALKFTERTLSLYDVASGRHLATLESPGDARLGTCSFSGDGALLVASDVDWGGVVTWDLRAIRQRLASLGLDWDTPPFSEDKSIATSGEWRVTISEAAFASRDPLCTVRQIDLTPHYNATFHNLSRFTGNADNDLSALPTGLQSFHGIGFDLRGVVQLFGHPKHPIAPSVATGIKVGQSCRSLHFLHSALFLTSLQIPGNKTVAEYVIHWVDGETTRVPVKNFVHVADWWFSSGWFASRPHLLDTNSTVIAWHGTNLASASAGTEIQLYKFRWDNPRPEVLVASVDFESIDAAPFLVAVTAE